MLTLSAALTRIHVWQSAFIVEVAWQAHFVTNMFIQPTAEELRKTSSRTSLFTTHQRLRLKTTRSSGLNSETAVMFNITSREQVIVNTWYGGEMKKGMFSMMNYYLPLKGIASNALLRQHRHERREHSYFLRSFGNR